MYKQKNADKPSITSNEQGLVSIIIVVVLMFVISLITLSYANIARNEQQQALDRTLNAQAYYAAESGINYATKTITDRIKNGTPINLLVKPDCKPDPPSGIYGDQLQIDAATGVSTSCLLVQTNPKSLVYDLSTSDQSKVFPVKPESLITRVVVEWNTQSSGPVSNCTNTATLPVAGSWSCPYGALRVDLANTSAGLSRSLLAQNTFSTVFMPVQSSFPGAGSVTFSGKNAFGGNSAMQGARAPASCDNTRCTMSITFASANMNEYYMRIMPLYRGTQATITARNGSNLVSLKDAQIVVDATGKAQDVLRRVQVRIPLVNDGIHADYGIQSAQSVCKLFDAFPGYSNTMSAATCP